MNKMTNLIAALSQHPRAELAHTPTPMEEMGNLGTSLGLELFVKRDDCTGLAFGGNKVRQLEFYFGEALAQKADVVLITGAVQSNYVRTAAAFARRLGMDCHIQLEERVPNDSDIYRENGNVLLDQLLGATLHSYPDGEDEAGADKAVGEIADQLRKKGMTPYIIPLGGNSKPLGALGYVAAAIELFEQLKAIPEFDEIVIASGSALTHSGLLFGLRTLGVDVPIQGICVRRNVTQQKARVIQRVEDLAKLMGLPNPVKEGDFKLYDGVLEPGYGQLNDLTIEAIQQTARLEGLFLDPVYTGKVMAGLIALAKAKQLSGKRVLFWHTGGTPALFGYANQLVND